MTNKELKIKLEEWITLLENDEKSSNTLKKYKTNVNSFINYCEAKELNKKTVREFKNKLDQVDKFLPNTTNSYIIAINKFLKYIGYGDLTVNIIKVQKKYSLEEYMTLTDYRRLKKFTLNHGDEQSYFIFRVLGETGIRISELQYFTVENLSNTMIVQNKGKKREIIVKIDLLRDLRKYIRKFNIKRGPIFPRKNNSCETITANAIWKRMKKWAGLARIKKELVHPHAFRHLFARQYLEAYPDDIVGLANLLGHNSLDTTRIYTQLSNKEKELKLRKVKF